MLSLLVLHRQDTEGAEGGLIDLLQGKSEDVRIEALAWYAIAKNSDWADSRLFARAFPMSTWSMGFSYSRSDGIVNASSLPRILPPEAVHQGVLTHKEYDRKERKKQWP